MIGMYCRDHDHVGRRPDDRDDDALCRDCRELLAYAHRRLDACPFGDEKPTCADCPVHCYAPAKRERVREVMRHSGPRMLLRHPVLGVAHLVDGRRGPRRH